MSLNQPLAYRQAEAGRSERAFAIATRKAAKLAE